MDPGGDRVHNCTMLRNPAHLSKRNRSAPAVGWADDRGLLGKRGRVERQNPLRAPNLLISECLGSARFSRISITFQKTIGMVPILDSLCRIPIIPLFLYATRPSNSNLSCSCQKTLLEVNFLSISPAPVFSGPSIDLPMT